MNIIGGGNDWSSWNGGSRDRDQENVERNQAKETNQRWGSKQAWARNQSSTRVSVPITSRIDVVGKGWPGK